MDQQQLNKLMLGDYANREKPAIYPEKFYEEYKPGANPLVDKPIEMVKWVKRGSPGSGGVLAIEKVKKDPLWWSVLQPFYDAWKKGQEVPVTGTPLSAWPGCSPADKERFNFLRLYTVEDVANMTDNDCDRFGIGAREKKALAKAYLEAGNQQEAARELEALRQQIGQLRSDYADALDAIRSLKAKLPADEKAAMDASLENPVKRGPGRPPKDKAA